MMITYRYLVYPDGDRQETETPLRLNQLVDLNGYPIIPPLRSQRTIVYRVYKIRRVDGKGEETTFYHLELVGGAELVSLVR